MAEEAESAPNDELVEEVAGGQSGATARVERLKKLFGERIARARRDRLAEARRGYQTAITSKRVCESQIRPSIDEIRRRIAEVFTQGREAGMALAFRNGEYQSESDLVSLWDQLCELGAVNRKDYG